MGTRVPLRLVCDRDEGLQGQTIRSATSQEGNAVSIQAMASVIGSHQHGYQDGSSNKGAL